MYYNDGSVSCRKRTATNGLTVAIKTPLEQKPQPTVTPEAAATLEQSR
jgi:hypothetical protein